MEIKKELSFFDRLLEQTTGLSVDAKETQVEYTMSFQDFKAAGKIFPTDAIVKNSDFFGALRSVGIYPYGMKMDIVPAPHNRRFNLLSKDIMFMGNRGCIIGFRVPELGAHHLHRRVAMDSFVLQEENIVGKGNHMIVRAREKLDGIECVVFSVVYPDMEIYYLWEGNTIRQIRSSHVCVYEKVGDKFFLLSDVPPTFSTEIRYSLHPWRTLDMKLMNECKEGIIVDCDLEQYKVPRDLTVTVKVCGDVYLDAHDKPLSLSFDQKSKDQTTSLVDVKLDGSFVKCRPDRAYADSAQQIDVITNCAIDLRSFIKLFAVQPVGVEVTDLKMELGPKDAVIPKFNEEKVLVLSKNFGRVEKTPGKVKRSEFIKQVFDAASAAKKPFHFSDIGVVCANNFLHPKDGYLHSLKYSPPIIYDEGGISNVSRKGYFGLAVSSDMLPATIAHLFYYKNGVCFLFYDRSRWRVKLNNNTNNNPTRWQKAYVEEDPVRGANGNNNNNSSGGKRELG